MAYDGRDAFLPFRYIAGLLHVINGSYFSKILVKYVDFDRRYYIMSLERYERRSLMATIKDVAQAAQVSTAAVSRV